MRYHASLFFLRRLSPPLRQLILLICKEPVAKAFYPIPGRRLLCALFLPEGDPMGDSGFAMRNFSTYSEICINYATPSVKEATLRVCNVALSMLGTNEKASVSAYIVCQVESEQRFHPLNKERREFNWRGNLRQANRSILSDRWIMAKISKGCKSAAGNLCSLKPANVTPSKRHELRDGRVSKKVANRGLF